MATRLNRCIDCGTLIDRVSTRCRPCYWKAPRARSYPEGGNAGHRVCKGCGGLRDRRAEMCRKCRNLVLERQREDIRRGRRRQPDPLGLCECGCGQPAPLVTFTSRAGDCVKGERRRFINGHHFDAVSREALQRWRETLGPDYTINESGCWIWARGLTPEGYGRKMVSAKRHVAHRWFYEQRHGPIPRGWHVHHVCGVRACVNPEHLEALSPGSHGATQGTSLALTAEILTSDESNRAIARRLGINRTTIARIRAGRTINAQRIIEELRLG